MKKIKIILFAFVIMGLFTTNVYAADFGVLNSVKDTVVPEGENAKIIQRITAETNEKGEVAFPLYSKSELLDVKADKGTVLVGPEVVEYGDQSYYLLGFQEKEAEVQFTVTMTKKGVYKGKSAKLGDTFPNGAITVEHKVINSSPNTILSYTASLATPKGKELLNIVGYDAEEAFTIGEEEGDVIGGFDFEEVAPGQEVKLAINLYQPQRVHSIMIWVLSGLISVAFMLKSKDLLKGKAVKE